MTDFYYLFLSAVLNIYNNVDFKLMFITCVSSTIVFSIQNEKL